MPEYEFSFTRIFPYNNAIVDSVLIHQNTDNENTTLVYFTQCSGMEGIIKQPPTDVLKKVDLKSFAKFLGKNLC